MGLKERIEQFRRREHGNMLREDAYAASEVNDVLDDVSEYAQEADALMEEMAEAIESLMQDCSERDQDTNALGGPMPYYKIGKDALRKYKEQTQ